MDPVLDRVMSKIAKDISGCWIWTAGHTGNGYPNVKVNGMEPLIQECVWTDFVKINLAVILIITN